ncbi:MAG: tRNA (guanosine(37)-N1)-methyltransferase TrmD [Polyangia bacterium]
MQIEVVTLFPAMFDSVLAASLLGKARDKGLVVVRFTDPRDFAPGKHRSVDDSPYGGGAGMVMRAGPIVEALETIEQRGPVHKVLLGPAGTTLDRDHVNRLARHERLALVCGRYEGYDERVAAFVDEELSIGDYVLQGGELAAMVIIDAVARRLEGVLGNAASAQEESFESGLLEHPQYTRPPDFRGALVPDVLLSGDHAAITRWRRTQSLERTRERRPDLFEKAELDRADRIALGLEAPPEKRRRKKASP